MILDELTVHNFGIYRGRQSLILTPRSPNKPITLVGGLNGGGKTTLLDAIQLALFGRMAPCTNPGASAYNGYLREMIHRSVPKSEGASVELVFRHILDGVQQQVRIHRSWRSTGKGFREYVEIERDGKLDPLLSEHWLESIDQYIPLGIAGLVFFDGEKIESLADPTTSAEALAAAIHGLLGLGIVDRLAADLEGYERRNRVRNQSNVADRSLIEDSEKKLTQLAAERDRLVTERGTRQNAIDVSRKTLTEVESRFARQGGRLLERRRSIESRLEEARAKIKDLEVVLRDLAGGIAPLLLVPKLIQATEKRAVTEYTSIAAIHAHRILEAHDKRILSALRREAVVEEALCRFECLLIEDRVQQYPSEGIEVMLGLPDSVKYELTRIIETVLADEKDKIATAQRRFLALQVEVNKLEAVLGSIPEEGSLASILGERTKAQEALQEAEEAFRVSDRHLQDIRRTYERERLRCQQMIEREASEILAHEDDKRAVEHANRVRGTLKEFRVSLVKRNIERIASLVLDGLRTLLRKEHLIASIEIDPQEFRIRLEGPNATSLLPQQLSAGERQLLAIALLWGLARAAARPLPVIIDTPLGRLDSFHRLRLIENYFPCASHQVVLLSTDEEVTAEYWRILSQYVGRCYTLAHDDLRSSSQIQEGYFW